MDNQKVRQIQLKYGLNNLLTCEECGNQTLHRVKGFEDTIDYECYFCGYLNNSSFKNPIHGKYYVNPDDKHKKKRLDLSHEVMMEMPYSILYDIKRELVDNKNPRANFLSSYTMECVRNMIYLRFKLNNKQLSQEKKERIAKLILINYDKKKYSKFIDYNAKYFSDNNIIW